MTPWCQGPDEEMTPWCQGPALLGNRISLRDERVIAFHEFPKSSGVLSSS